MSRNTWNARKLLTLDSGFLMSNEIMTTRDESVFSESLCSQEVEDS